MNVDSDWDSKLESKLESSFDSPEDRPLESHATYIILFLVENKCFAVYYKQNF